MKRKDLYNYVREEIINELTIITKNTSSDEIPNIAKAEKIDTSSVKKAVDTAKSSGKDVNIAELARHSSNIVAGENFNEIKSLYAGSIIERILNIIEEAGEEGTTVKKAIEALGGEIKHSSQFNPIKNELIELGAISGPLTSTEEPEETSTDAEETDTETTSDNKEVDDDEFIEVDKDEWEKPEDEEEPEVEEPKAADIKAADKEAEKVAGGKSNAQKLSPEDEEKYTKLKKGIESKITKLLGMPKAKREASDDMKILKQLINRDDVKKLFKAKGVGLKDIASDIF
jgi:hypothetical protein